MDITAVRLLLLLTTNTFIGQFSELAQMMSDAGCEMFNCTEGGAFIDNFEHVPLSQVLSDVRVKGMKTVHENNELTRDLGMLSNFLRSRKSKFLR